MLVNISIISLPVNEIVIFYIQVMGQKPRNY
jgi:hypothetical protein